MRLCYASCRSILKRTVWCQKLANEVEKNQGELERDSYSCLILEDLRGEMIKWLLQRVTKKSILRLSKVQMSLVSLEHSGRLCLIPTC